MELIIGGAYQGKENYVKSAFSLSKEDIYVCDTENEPDFSKKCLSHIEKWSYQCVKNGVEPSDAFFEHVLFPNDLIVISDDVSCGVVPIDPIEREWREANGRLLLRLAEKSEHVIRVFCGIPVRLK